GLLASEDATVRQLADYGLVHMTARGDCSDKLVEHIVDEALKIGLLFFGKRARGGPGILEVPALEHNALQFGPFQKFAVIVPLCNYADASGDGAGVGKDFVRRACDVVGPRSAHGRHADDDL